MATNLSLQRDDIIKAALRRIGVLGEGETPSTSQVTDAATALNIIVKEFDAAPWFKWFIKSVETTVATVAGTASYALASDVQWVESVVYDDGSIHYPLEPLTVGEYAKIPNKVRQGLPMYYFVSTDIATPTMYVYPAPNEVKTLNYWYKRKTDLFDDATDTSDFPEEFYRVLVNKLAVDLSFEYGLQRDDKQLLIGIYTESLQNILQEQGQQITGQMVTQDSQLLNAPGETIKDVRPTSIGIK